MSQDSPKRQKVSQNGPLPNRTTPSAFPISQPFFRKNEAPRERPTPEKQRDFEDISLGTDFARGKLKNFAFPIDIPPNI
jgi:hypothetical protein